MLFSKVLVGGLSLLGLSGATTGLVLGSANSTNDSVDYSWKYETSDEICKRWKKTLNPKEYQRVTWCPQDLSHSEVK